MTTKPKTRGSMLLAFYYAIKPCLPRRVRYALRRCVARRTRSRAEGEWPVKLGTETPPANWPGWPEGKKFAFVLTHDVEGQKGLDRCRLLMELEAKHGFRSSFNFVPEGEYQVSRLKIIPKRYICHLAARHAFAAPCARVSSRWHRSVIPCGNGIAR